MTTSYRNSAGTDTDNLFDPDIVGDGPSATGYKKSDGTLLKYAAAKYGTVGPNTGYRLSNGADIATLWAAKGTANYKLPINGKTYSADGISSGGSPVKPCSGKVELLIGGGQYNIRTTVINNGGTAVVTDNLFTLPTGMTQFQINVAGVIASGGTQSGSVAWTAIPATLTSYLNFYATRSNNTGTNSISGNVTLNTGSTAAAVFTGTCSFEASADISA